MNSRPYFSEAANVYNENTYRTEPAVFGHNHLLVSHGQHRRICDSESTSVTGNPLANLYGMNMQLNHLQAQPQMMQSQKHTIPEGVTYTFNPMARGLGLPNFSDFGVDYRNINQNQVPYQQPVTLEQQIAMNELQKHALESILLHEKFKNNPFKLQFHKDGQTDTTDLNYCCTSCQQQSPSKPFKMIGESMMTELSKIDTNRNSTLKPESLLPKSSTLRRLSFSGELNQKQDTNKDQHLDKSIQHMPDQENIETQYDGIKECDCPKKDYNDTESQTEVRKVTFDANYKSDKIQKKSTRKRGRKVRRVDDGSSDSSGSSSSSKSDNSE